MLLQLFHTANILLLHHLLLNINLIINNFFDLFSIDMLGISAVFVLFFWEIMFK